jgi:hypothetical protein
MVDAVHGAENFAMRSEISQETQAGATSEGPREGVSVDVLLQWLIHENAREPRGTLPPRRGPSGTSGRPGHLTVEISITMSTARHLC